MRFTARHIGLEFAIAGVVAVALGGCQLREDGNEPDPVESEAPTMPGATKETPGSSPAPAESQGASIIRQDTTTEEEFEIPVLPFKGTIPFSEGGADLSPAAETALEGVLGSDAMSEGWPIILRGHSDSGGNDQANVRVSRARAEAVAAWLVERGVNDSRFEVIAFGEQNPVAPNALPDGTANEAGRRQNRRVEVEIAPPESADKAAVPKQG